MLILVVRNGIGVAVVTALALSLPSYGCSKDGVKTDVNDTDTWPNAVDPEIDWIVIPAGSFQFGSPDGTPCIKPMMEKVVPVTLTRSFLMAKTEVTQNQWAAMGFQVPPILPVCENCPIAYLSWYEALLWCNALSRFEGLEECYVLSNCTGKIGSACWPPTDVDCNEETGAVYSCAGKTRRYNSMYDCTGYRLPTAAEWEYAAKAGTTTNTYNGDITEDSDGLCVDEPILNDIAWYCGNTGYTVTDPWDPDSLDLLQEVGLKQPNPFGLHDMLGNASEWTDYVGTGFSLDSNDGKPDEALVDPMGTTEDDDPRRDLRGGSYYGIPCVARAASQADDLGDHRGPGYGFRPVRTLPAGSVDGGVK